MKKIFIVLMLLLVTFSVFGQRRENTASFTISLDYDLSDNSPYPSYVIESAFEESIRLINFLSSSQTGKNYFHVANNRAWADYTLSLKHFVEAGSGLEVWSITIAPVGTDSPKTGIIILEPDLATIDNITGRLVGYSVSNYFENLRP